MAGLLVVTGLVHASIAPGHFQQWWGYGLIFALAATAQLGLGIVVWTRRDPRALRAGVGIALVAIGGWTLSRSVGLPLAAGRRLGEAAGLLDVLTTTGEAVMVAMVLGAPERCFGRRGLDTARAAGVIIIAALAVAFASGIGHD